MLARNESFLTVHLSHSMFFIRGRLLSFLPIFDSSLSLSSLFFSRLSTKPGCVPSTLKSHSLTAERQFLASNTVWRFRRGVRLYCLTMMKSSTGDSPVSSVQVQRPRQAFVAQPLLVVLLPYIMLVCFVASFHRCNLEDMAGSFPRFLHRSPEGPGFGKATFIYSPLVTTAISFVKG